MKESLLYITKLAASASFSWLKIIVLSAFSTALVVTFGFVLLAQGINAGNSGHVSAIPFLTALFFTRPLGSALWGLVAVGSVPVLVSLGHKYVLSKLVNQIMKDKSHVIIEPILEKAIAKLGTGSSQMFQTAGDVTAARLQLIQNVKSDKTGNKWLRRVAAYGLKKVRLSEADLAIEKGDFYTVLKSRLMEKMQSLFSPSRKGIFIGVALQWAILLFIWQTNY